MIIFSIDVINYYFLWFFAFILLNDYLKIYNLFFVCFLFQWNWTIEFWIFLDFKKTFIFTNIYIFAFILLYFILFPNNLEKRIINNMNIGLIVKISRFIFQIELQLILKIKTKLWNIINFLQIYLIKLNKCNK